MERDTRLSLLVGAFVLAALAAFGLAVLSLSARQGLWTGNYELVGHFKNVQGLIAGAPVRLAGKDVGIVKSVDFEPVESGRAPVRVALQIDESIQDRIRSDSVARIGTIGLLGDKYVLIEMGSREGAVLQAGEEVPTLNPANFGDVISTGTQTLDNVATLAANVNAVVEDFQRAMGGARLAQSADALASIVSEVEQGEGLLHTLIYEPFEAKGFQSIADSLQVLEEMVREIRHGEGILHSLIYDRPTEQGIVLETIEAGARLNSILGKIDRGEGTLGLLLSDPTVYEDLKRLLRGAERSILVRSLIELSAGSAR